ncbi:MAG: VanZ family protein [Turicibacter sp.]|nr:VanZ family protein [Turicibacter sp.]
MLNIMEIIIENFILERPIILAYMLFSTFILCVIYQLLFLSSALKKENTFHLQHFVWVFLFLTYLAITYHLIDVRTLGDMIQSTASPLSEYNPQQTDLWFYFFLALPLGIFLPLIWTHLREIKTFAILSTLFAFIVHLNDLIAFGRLSFASIIACFIGASVGYLLFKGVFIFFNKGIPFQTPNTPYSPFIRNEAIVYLFLSFVGVFLLYHPDLILSQVTETEVNRTIAGHELRHDIIVTSENNDGVFRISFRDFHHYFDDPRDDLLCELLGTCQTGSLIGFTDTTIDVFSSRHSPILSINTEFGSLLVDCELEIGNLGYFRDDYLICTELDDFHVHYTENTYYLAADARFEIWMTDGFGTLIMVNSTRYDMLVHDHIRFDLIEIDGIVMVERVISYRMAHELWTPGLHSWSDVDDGWMYDELRERYVNPPVSSW